MRLATATRARSATQLRGVALHIEHLESRHLLAADPVIVEVMAANDDTLIDEDGNSSDWLEILNAGDSTVDLRGWYLTDDAADLTMWRFPTLELSAGESTVVFASNKDRRIEGRQLHTNFRLAAGGEYLALVEPDGVTVAAEFAPQYPPQVVDVSYGIPTSSVTTRLTGDGSSARVLVPTDGSVDPLGDVITGSWLDPGFDDAAAGWFDATTGIGYETGLGTRVVLADSSLDWSATGAQGHNNWFYGYYDRTSDAGRVYQTNNFQQFPDNYFADNIWEWPGGGPRYTSIGQQDMQTNGINSGGDEHWPIRRYVSEADGILEITWTLRKLDIGGNGVTGRVLHNGEEVDRAVIRGNDDSGVAQTVSLAEVQASTLR